MKLKATFVDADEDGEGFCAAPATHSVQLDEAIGSGTSSVVFQVSSVEHHETSTERTSLRSDVVAKVSKKGAHENESAHGARAEARILSGLKPHLNVVGFHGLFCTTDTSEELNLVLGTFATRTFSKKLYLSRVASSSFHSQANTAPASSPSPHPDSSATLRFRTHSDEPDHSLGGHMIAGLLEPMPGLHLFTLQERCDRCLKDYLKKHSPSESQLAFIVSSIMQGLGHIHQQHVFHRDLTDGNILLTDMGRRIVLCDFDLSVQTRGASEVVWRCGTPGFVAPEVLTKRRGTARSDIFSVGVVAFFAACGTHAFMKDSYKATAYSTIHDEPDFWGGQVLQRSHECLSLIDSMLCKQGFLRPSAAETLLSSWLEHTPKQDLQTSLRKSSFSSVVSPTVDAVDPKGAAKPPAPKPKTKSCWKKLASVQSVFSIGRLFSRKGKPRLSEHRLAQVVPN